MKTTIDHDICALSVRVYRELNPSARAISPWTYVNSTGTVRKATCTFCREVIATCSGRYPETVGFRRKADSHGAACAREYLAKALAEGRV